MARRHANEFLRTTFTNSGRIAGMGICHDDYSETSFPGRRKEHSPKPVGITKIEEQKKAEKETPVTTYKLTRYEVEQLLERKIEAENEDRD